MKRKKRLTEEEKDEEKTKFEWCDMCVSVLRIDDRKQYNRWDSIKNNNFTCVEAVINELCVA